MGGIGRLERLADLTALMSSANTGGSQQKRVIV
jgi:hypothetical protein